MRAIYTAASAEAASVALDAFAADTWGRRFPTIVKMWRQAWEHVIPFFAFPPDVRRVIYTTNALESVHARVLARAPQHHRRLVEGRDTLAGRHEPIRHSL